MPLTLESVEPSISLRIEGGRVTIATVGPVRFDPAALADHARLCQAIAEALDPPADPAPAIFAALREPPREPPFTNTANVEVLDYEPDLASIVEDAMSEIAAERERVERRLTEILPGARAAYRCGHCGQGFATEHGLKVHTGRVHCDFACSWCAERFTTHDLVLAHIALTHPIDDHSTVPVAPDDVSDPMSFECPQCLAVPGAACTASATDLRVLGSPHLRRKHRTLAPAARPDYTEDD